MPSNSFACPAWGGCARSASGTVRSCVAVNDGMLHTMRSVTAESFVHFEVDAAGKCTGVKVHNGSQFGWN